MNFKIKDSKMQDQSAWPVEKEVNVLASAQFTMDKPYFEMSFRDFTYAVRRSRYWQRHVSIGVIVGSAVVAYWQPVAAVFSLAGGIYYFAEFYWARYRWVRDRLKARPTNSYVEIQFTDDGISMSGPTSSGKVAWEGIHALHEGRVGLILSIGDGMSVYVPRVAIKPATSIGDVVEAARRRIRGIKGQ